jgi:Putative transposase
LLPSLVPLGRNVGRAACVAKALAKLVRGKFRAPLQRTCPDPVIPDAVRRKPWILNVTAWGNREQAVLDYLARYVFRIALTNVRIVGLDEETVTFQYKVRKTGCSRTCRLSGEEFIRRFLQHVLPRGFHKVPMRWTRPWSGSTAAR